MPFRIVRNDITKMNIEAIVNTANEQVEVGPGCDAAVYQAAGYDELLAYRKQKIGVVNEGESFLTPGFGLMAKHIIHTVSPLYIDGEHGEEEKLRACYQNSLKLAQENGIREIAFPLISTGSFGYPKEEGMRIAIDEINAFLLSHEMNIVLVVFDAKATIIGEHLYPGLEAYIDHNYVLNKNVEEYGDFLTDLVIPLDEEAFDTAIRRSASKEERYTPKKEKDKQKAVSDKQKAESIKPYTLGSQPDFSVDRQKVRKCSSTMNADVCASESFAELNFEEEHEDKLEERMQHITDTFSQYLLFLIQSKGMENTAVYKRAIVDKKIFSKIKNNTEYHPQKITALCLCVGAMLNLDEARDLLARAGYALSPCDKTDIIFTYFIENKIYDMIELDIQLEEHGLPCIIT